MSTGSFGLGGITPGLSWRFWKGSDISANVLDLLGSFVDSNPNGTYISSSSDRLPVTVTVTERNVRFDTSSKERSHMRMRKNPVQLLFQRYNHNHQTLLLAVEILLRLLLQLNLLLFDNLAKLLLRILLDDFVLLLLLGALGGAAGERLVEEVLVLALAAVVGAWAFGDVGFAGGMHC